MYSFAKVAFAKRSCFGNSRNTSIQKLR